jgi:general secretion pathway protein L
LETLFVRITEPARLVRDTWILRSLSWLVLDRDGQVLNQGSGDAQALTELIDPALRGDTDRVVVVVPAELCLSLQVSVPGRSTRQIRRALPFVVEEHLASDIDQVQIAHGSIQRQAPVDCMAVERQHLRSWCLALATVGITPCVMLSEAELLPRRNDEIQVFFDEGRVLIRTPQQSLVAEDDTLSLTLAGAVQQLDAHSPVNVHCYNGVLTDTEKAQIAQAAPAPLHWIEDETEGPGFVALARFWLTDGNGTNLLQGDFAPVPRQNPNWARWRSVAVLAAVWFVVALVAQAGQALWADYRAAALDADIRMVYRSHFPDDPRVSFRSPDAMRAQLAQRIGADGGSSGFLALTGLLADALQSGNGTSLRGLTYNDVRLELSIDLHARDFAALERLRDRLASEGVAVDISSAEQQDQLVRARLRIRG